MLSEQNWTHVNVSPVAGSLGSPTAVGTYNVKYPSIGMSPIVETLNSYVYSTSRTPVRVVIVAELVYVVESSVAGSVLEIVI